MCSDFSEATVGSLLTVHSLCPQQMWHDVSTAPYKLAVEPSPAWRTPHVTQMACMISASPSYTVLLNLTLRYHHYTYVYMAIPMFPSAHGVVWCPMSLIAECKNV